MNPYLRYLGCNTAFAKDAGLEQPDDVIGKDDYQMVWADRAELYGVVSPKPRKF